MLCVLTALQISCVYVLWTKTHINEHVTFNFSLLINMFTSTDYAFLVALLYFLSVESGRVKDSITNHIHITDKQICPSTFISDSMVCL